MIVIAAHMEQIQMKTYYFSYYFKRIQFLQKKIEYYIKFYSIALTKK